MHKYKTHVAIKNGRHRAPERVAAELLKIRFEENENPVLIAIGGPGGTGKSTFAKALMAELPDARVLRLDDYKTSRSFRSQRNIFGPHPDANKFDLLLDHLTEMRSGHNFSHPVYNKELGEATESSLFKTARFNILDGEISTYRAFRDLVDFSVFIDSDWKTQLATRVGRDIVKRGYDGERAIATFLQSNLREFSEYGAESKKWADMHLYCDSDYHLMIESVSDELFQEHDELFASDYEEVGLLGLIVPVLTPFTDEGAVDQRAFIQHLEFLAHSGVHRIMVNGTTAEFYSLSAAERKLLLKLARRYFPGMIILHAGGGNLAQNLEEVRWANEFGADAVAALPPTYPAGLPEAGVIDYLCALEEKAEVPFILYNFPKHTGNPLTPKILKAVPHTALKDSAQNLELIDSTPKYFIGSSTRIHQPILQGAIGFVSATANVQPSLYVGLETAMTYDLQPDDAATIQSKIEKYSAPFSSGGVPLLKKTLGEVIPGYPSNVRLPLREF